VEKVVKTLLAVGYNPEAWGRKKDQTTRGRSRYHPPLLATFFEDIGAYQLWVVVVKRDPFSFVVCDGKCNRGSQRGTLSTPWAERALLGCA